MQTLQPIEQAFPWAKTLADWLIAKKKLFPHIQIVVLLDTQTIEDPSRTNKGIPPLTRHRLEDSGIFVFNSSLVETKFQKKQFAPKAYRLNEYWEDSQNIKKFTKREWAYLQNIWQTLHNVEDHRKNLVIDNGRAGVVFSHNVIDQAYLWQENTFLLRKDLSYEIWKFAIHSVKKAVELPIQWNEAEKEIFPWLDQQIKSLSNSKSSISGTTKSKILKNGPEILKSILEEIRNIDQNGIEEICVSSAYFSDLQTLEELIQLSTKIRVKIMVDSCEALSLKKFLKIILTQTVNLVCIHNCRKVDSIELKIFPSSLKEMMHCKFILFIGKNSCLIAGQANFTPNSFSGAWMETNIWTSEKKVIDQVQSHFQEMWNRSEKIVVYDKMNITQRISIKAKTYFFLIVLKIVGLLGFQY